MDTEVFIESCEAKLIEEIAEHYNLDFDIQEEIIYDLLQIVF